MKQELRTAIIDSRKGLKSGYKELLLMCQKLYNIHIIESDEIFKKEGNFFLKFRYNGRNYLIHKNDYIPNLQSNYIDKEESFILDFYKKIMKLEKSIKMNEIRFYNRYLIWL
jgi:hypothetical protein